MNKIYRTVYSEVLGTWVAVSENTAARGKRSSSAVTGALVTVGVAAQLFLFAPNYVFAQTLPEAQCTSGSGGTMYTADPTCVNYVNNTRIYLNSLSTSTSTTVGSLSTGISTSRVAETSLSTGLSTANSNVTSLSTSTSTGISTSRVAETSLSTGLSSTNSNVTSLSTGIASLSTGLSTTNSNVSSLSTSTS
ncbi:Extended Signal Peptide of Type V secretion system, partial [Collimonas sp. OK242]